MYQHKFFNLQEIKDKLYKNFLTKEEIKKIENLTRSRRHFFDKKLEDSYVRRRMWAILKGYEKSKTPSTKKQEELRRLNLK